MRLIPITRTGGAGFNPDWAGALAGLVLLLGFVPVAPGQVSVETVGGGVRAECGASAGFVAGNTWMTAQFSQPYATALDSQGNLWVADFKNSDVEEVTLAGNRTSSITYQYASGSNKHPFPGVVGVALDSANNLYVLTQTSLFKFADVTVSFPDLDLLFDISLNAFSSAPATAITVVNDAATNIYISFTNSSGGAILRIPQPYNGTFSTVVGNYSFAPSGLAMREDGQLAVSDTRNSGIYLVATNNGTTPVLLTGGYGPGFGNGGPGFARFNQPHGIAASADGRMVVCDTLNNYVRLIDTNNNTTTLYGTASNVWTGTCCSCDPALYAGWVDGAAGTGTTSASGRQPVSITISSNGTLFVTELYYNLIRAVSGSGLLPVTSPGSISSSTNVPLVTTLAATAVTGSGATLNASVNPNGSPTTVFFQWGTNTSYGSNTTSVVLSSNLAILNPVALPLTGLPSNTVIHFQAVAFNNGGTAYGGDRTLITTPVLASGLTISPSFGYFPECQTITVTSSVRDVFYTEDGSGPTTNSAQVEITQTNSAGYFIGSFQWCNAQADLSTLQLITSSGGVVSSVLTGSTPTNNQLGFMRSPTGGIGSWAFIPIVLDLRNGAGVESLQFRVEVTPNGTAPPISSLTLMPITPNDFVQVIGPSPGNAPVSFSTIPYTNTVSSNGQGLVIFTEGIGTGLNIQNFGVVGFLEFQIPTTAGTNQTYNLNILYPSATAVGGQIGVVVTNMPSQTLTVADLPYLVGDSAPAYGYSSEEFGDGILDNRDVNNAIYASTGMRVPPVNSDSYNAMCVLPQTANLNGNGVINFSDWNEILLRSLGVHTTNWIRSWTNNGFLFGSPTVDGLPGNPAVPTDTALAQASQMGSPPGLVWLCPASIGSGTVANLVPGNTCSLPVYANVLTGYSLSGLQFRAIVTPNGSAPPVGQVQFNPAGSVPSPSIALPGISSNDIIRAWPLGGFPNALQNSNYLGAITFQIPPSAQAGQSYAVHFAGVDGAPDDTTDYAMESFPGCAWVLSAAQQPASVTSDEWKVHFFGSVSNSLAADNVDADGDGVPNWQEYLAGTDPTNPASVFQFTGAGFSSGGASGFAVNWLTAPGKTYILQSIPALGGNTWTAINTNTGDGYNYQFTQSTSNGNAQFYRILLKP